jgi:hypothetical protein
MYSLHFIKTGLHIPYFKTCTNFGSRLKVTQICCECDPIATPTGEDSRGKLDFRTQFLGTDAFLHQDRHYSRPENLSRPKQWRNIVEEFTSRAMSYETDRLPAISGLAGLTQAGPHDEYICGIWRKELVRGLLWRVKNSSLPRSKVSLRHQKYYAPSWTWASVTGAVVYVDWLSGNDTYVEDLEIIHVSYTLASPNPFGPVTHASIVVRGFLIPVCVQESQPNSSADFSVHLLARNSRSHYQSTFLRGISMDVFGEGAAHFEVAMDEQLFLVPVLRITKSIMTTEIVVRIVQSEKDVYQRVGSSIHPQQAFLGDIMYDSFSDLVLGLWYDTAQRQEFTIV